jgi:hypothetical protein
MILCSCGIPKLTTAYSKTFPQSYKINGIPPTSIPQKAAFLAAGELISPKRSKLSPEMEEKMLFFH